MKSRRSAQALIERANMPSSTSLALSCMLPAFARAPTSSTKRTATPGRKCCGPTHVSVSRICVHKCQVLVLVIVLVLILDSLVPLNILLNYFFKFDVTRVPILLDFIQLPWCFLTRPFMTHKALQKDDSLHSVIDAHPYPYPRLAREPGHEFIWFSKYVKFTVGRQFRPNP